MKEGRANGYKGVLLPATSTSKRLGYFPLGSELSRAAARALAIARRESEAIDYWERELKCTRLAERFNSARQRSLRRAESGVTFERRTPICIPPGKENTPRGRLTARINVARERIRQYEAR